jgi:hypothetical protein
MEDSTPSSRSQAEASDELPPHAFVPGGPWPRPKPSKDAGLAEPIEEDRWSDSPGFLRGVRLFNTGFYWEAHEVWEALWHAHGRRGATADVLKALIKLAAAGVKVREGQPRGAATHARRAAGLLDDVAQSTGRHRLGLDLAVLADKARSLAEHPPCDTAAPGSAVSRVFPFTLEPRQPPTRESDSR